MKKSARLQKQTELKAEAARQRPSAWGMAGTVWAVAIILFYLFTYPINTDYLGHVIGAMSDFSIFHAYLTTILGGFFVGALLIIAAARGGAHALPEAV